MIQKGKKPEIWFRALDQGILTQVFNMPSGSTSHRLELHDVKNAEGEIGLKASTSEHFFGIVNIGDKFSFLKLKERIMVT